MRDPGRIKRYTLIPRSSPGQRPDGVRRYSLARVGATPRSAPGDDRLDRLERMERIAEAERRLARNGGASDVSPPSDNPSDVSPPSRRPSDVSPE